MIKEAEEQERAIELFIRKKRQLRETIEQRTLNLAELETKQNLKANERKKIVNTGDKTFHFERDGSMTEIKPVIIEKLPDFT